MLLQWRHSWYFCNLVCSRSGFFLLFFPFFLSSIDVLMSDVTIFWCLYSGFVPAFQWSWGGFGLASPHWVCSWIFCLKKTRFLSSVNGRKSNDFSLLLFLSDGEIFSLSTEERHLNLSMDNLNNCLLERLSIWGFWDRRISIIFQWNVLIFCCVDKCGCILFGFWYLNTVNFFHSFKSIKGDISVHFSSH